MNALGAWLDARDGAAVAQAWARLGAKRVELGGDRWTITPHAAAHFAAAFLGWPLERVMWLAAGEEELPPPTFATRGTVARCFLDQAVDRSEECFETWRIRELVDGARGVQHVSLEYLYDDGSREPAGGSVTLVRVFDRARGIGASIQTWRDVWTIGDVDLAALDLFAGEVHFRIAWKPYALDGVRGFLAQLAAELDAHYDVSATWPGTVTEHEVEGTAVRWYTWRFSSGERAIEIVEHRYRDDGVPETGSIRATVHGLPWGHVLVAHLSDDAHGVEGWLKLRLPRAHGDAVRARLASIPGVTPIR
ncbi:MAG: hypothetical protein KIT31_03125 [Deltaproteobacteria bacterium]|nr:hypothetical protein [Deltaproteobacteria bacterium]